jgi:hypothetical protein
MIDTAIPTFRIDIAHALKTISATDSENAPTGNPAGAHRSCSQAVRERRTQWARSVAVQSVAQR